jgi:hypothetical protein
MVAFGQSSQFVLGMVITAEDRASSVIRGVGSAIEQVGRAAVSMAGWYVGYQAISAVTSGVGSLIGNMVQLNAQAESFHATLLSLYRTPQVANRADDFITQFAVQTPATLDQVRAAALEAASAGLDLTKVMGSVGNAAAAMHTDIGTGMHGLVTALFGDTTVMRDQLHILPQDLVKFGLVMDNTGHIATNTLVPAFEAFVAKNYPHAMADQMKTAAGEFTNLQDAWASFERTAGKPLFTVLEKDLQRLMTFLSAHKDEVQQWAQGIGDAIGFAAGAISIGVPKMFQAIGTEWEHLKGTMGDVGDFFNTLGTGINKAFFLAIKGMTDLSNMAYNAMAGAVNSVVGLINRAMHDLFIVTQGKVGLSAKDPGIPTIQIDLAAQQRKERAYLRQMFPDIDPDTGLARSEATALLGYHGGGVGPDAFAQVNEFGQTLVQTLAEVRGERGKGSGQGGAGDQNGPLNVPGRGDFTDRAAERALLTAAVSAAQQQYQLDQLQGASQQKLLSDISGILAAMKAAGSTQLALDVERAQDMKALIGSVQTQAQTRFAADLQSGASRSQLLGDINALNAHLRAIGAPTQDLSTGLGRQLMQQLGQAEQQRAQTRLELDRLRGAPDAIIQRDIRAVLRGMTDAFASKDEIALQRLQLQGTKPPTQLPWVQPITYQRPDAASYGATIASFGMPQRDHLAEMVTLLRQELAASQRREHHDEEIIATLQAQLREQRTGTQAAALTAGNTTRLVAMGSQTPTPYRDPRAKLGAVHP